MRGDSQVRQVGEGIFVRYYGDPTWLPALVTEIHDKTVNAHLEEDHLGEGDMRWVEAHMWRRKGDLEAAPSLAPPSSSSSSAHHDVGFYVRGDYVEVCLENELVWKRARVALDEGDGRYTVRLEGGLDAGGVRGWRMRHLLRTGVEVDAKVDATGVWKRGAVVKREREGMYTVALESDGSQHRLYSRYIWPAGRASVREVAKAKWKQEVSGMNLHKVHEREQNTRDALSPTHNNTASNGHEETGGMENGSGKGASTGAGDRTFKPNEHTIGAKCKVQCAGEGGAISWMPGQVTGIDFEDGIATVGFVDGTVDTVPWGAIYIVDQPSPARSQLTRASLQTQNEAYANKNKESKKATNPGDGGHITEASNASVTVGEALSVRSDVYMHAQVAESNAGVGATAVPPTQASGHVLVPTPPVSGSPLDASERPASSRGYVKSSSESAVRSLSASLNVAGMTSATHHNGFTQPLLSASVDASTLHLPAIDSQTGEASFSPHFSGSPVRGFNGGVPTSPLAGTPRRASIGGGVLDASTTHTVHSAAGPYFPMPLAMCEHLNSSSLRDIFAHLVGDVSIRDAMLAFDIAAILVKEGVDSWEDVLRLDEYVGSHRGDQTALKQYFLSVGIPAIAAGKIASYTRRAHEVEGK